MGALNCSLSFREKQSGTEDSRSIQNILISTLWRNLRHSKCVSQIAQKVNHNCLYGF